MTEKLQHLLHDEADRLAVPPPPVDAILAGGRQRRRRNRTRNALVLAASLAVIAGGAAGLTRLVNDRDARSGGPAGTPTPTPTSQATPTGGTLSVAEAGVGTQPFGTDADEVRTAVTEQFGAPDLTVDPQHYFRIAGTDGWHEVADDPLSPTWQYPVVSVDCWNTLCLIYGGDDSDSLTLRGWELAQVRRWSGYDVMKDVSVPDVRLADTGITIGDSWEKLHAAYPATSAGGAEGNSLAVKNPPWPGIFDGVAGWRLSGLWDPSQNPTDSPDGTVLTRVSAGEGPEPGCC